MFNKNLSILIVSESSGSSLQFRFSYPMITAIIFLMTLIISGVSFIVWEMLENSDSAELMEENLLLQSQLQDFALDVVELERQMELLQMYAVQAEVPNTGAWFPDIWVLSSEDSKAEQLLHRLALVQQKSQLLYPTILKRAEQTRSKNAQFSAIPKAWPLQGIFTSPFGYRINPISGRRKFHAGIDIAAPTYTKIYAPGDGDVIWTGRKSGYGKTLEIDHGHGVITRYAHNSKILVKSGQQVKKGDVITKVGSTGDSTGPHLHYEIRVDGIAVDPIKYIIE